MDAFFTFLVVVLATPIGWMGLLCLAMLILALR